MKPSIVAKLELYKSVMKKIQALLAEADVIASQGAFFVRFQKSMLN